MLSQLQDTTRTGFWCMILASAGAFLFGFDNGWWGTIQGAEGFLKDFGSCELMDGVSKCAISTGQRSAGSSVQSAGIMLGSLLAIRLNQGLGRRMSLMVTGLISIVRVLLEMTSATAGSRPRFAQFVAGKAVASIAMGIAANVVPIFLSETATSAARGSAINMYQNIQIVGFVLAAAVVYASAQRIDAAAYLIPIGIQLLAPMTMVLLTPLLPESPRWLVWKGRHEEAVKSAQRLFGTPTNGFDSSQYIRKIEIAIEADRANPEASRWKDILQGPDLRRLLIAVGIQCWLQAMGSSYIVNYMVPFLNDIGINDVFPWIMGLSCIYYAGILTGHVLPDRFGRRPVILWSTAWCGVFMIIISGVVTGVSPASTSSGNACVAFLFLWQVASGIMSPLIWIICTEAAPTRNREKVLSVAIFFSFGISLLIASISPYLQDKGYGNLGGRIGFIWGSFSFVACAWCFFMVPETKGLSLEQIDYLYEQNTRTRKFRHHVFESDILPLETTSSHKEEVVKVASKV